MTGMKRRSSERANEDKNGGQMNGNEKERERERAEKWRENVNVGEMTFNSERPVFLIKGRWLKTF